MAELEAQLISPSHESEELKVEVKWLTTELKGHVEQLHLKKQELEVAQVEVAYAKNEYEAHVNELLEWQVFLEKKRQKKKEKEFAALLALVESQLVTREAKLKKMTLLLEREMSES